MKLSLLWCLLLVNGVTLVASDSRPPSPPPWSLTIDDDRVKKVESRKQPAGPSTPNSRADSPLTYQVFGQSLRNKANPRNVIGKVYYTNGESVDPEPLPYSGNGDLTTVCNDVSQQLDTQLAVFLPIATRIVPSVPNGSPSQILLSCARQADVERSGVQVASQSESAFQVRIVCGFWEPLKSPAIKRYYAASTGFSVRVDTDCPSSKALMMNIGTEIQSDERIDPQQTIGTEIQSDERIDPQQTIGSGRQSDESIDPLMNIGSEIQSDESIDPQPLGNKIGVVEYSDIHGRFVTLSYLYGGDLNSLCEQIRGSNGVAQVTLQKDNHNHPYLLVDCKDYTPSDGNTLFLQCLHVREQRARERSFIPFGVTDYERAQPWVEQFYNNTNVNYDCSGSRAYTDIIGMVNNLRSPQYYFRSQDLDEFCESLLLKQNSKFGHQVDDQYEAVSSQYSPSLDQGFDLQCAQGIWSSSGPQQTSSLDVSVQCVNFGTNVLDGLDRLYTGSLSPLKIASYYQKKDAANLEHSIRRYGVFKDCIGGLAHQKLTAEMNEAKGRPGYIPPSPLSSGSSQSSSFPSVTGPHQVYSPMFPPGQADATPPQTPPQTPPGRFRRVRQGVANGWGRVFNLRNANAPVIGIITRPVARGALTTLYRADQDLNDVCAKLYGGYAKTTIITLPTFGPYLKKKKKQQQQQDKIIMLTCGGKEGQASASIECFTKGGHYRINPMSAKYLGDYYRIPLDDCAGGLAEQAATAALAHWSPIRQSPASSPQQVSEVGSSSQPSLDPWEQAELTDKYRDAHPENIQEPSSPSMSDSPGSEYASAVQSPSRRSETDSPGLDYASAAQSPSQWSEVSEQEPNADRPQTSSPEIQEIPNDDQVQGPSAEIPNTDRVQTFSSQTKEKPSIPSIPNGPPNQDASPPPRNSWLAGLRSKFSSRIPLRRGRTQVANTQDNLQQGQAS